MWYKGTYVYKNIGVGGRPPATGCKAGMQLPPSHLINLAVINGSARASSLFSCNQSRLPRCLSVKHCSAYLSLNPSVNLHNLKNITCQTLPCPTQPSPSITMCAVRAINAAQDPQAVPFFARTRRSPLTFAAAQCARLRERGSTLCLCNANHPAGPRIRKQDPWELEGHGQYVPQRLPPPQASISYATYGILSWPNGHGIGLAIV
jgi:hypothetical protein